MLALPARDGKFVPRVRKHKVLARQKDLSKQPRTEPQDSNQEVILPQTAKEHEEKKARLREELRGGVKVSSKKAQRLEKYIQSKLKKDENRELLDKLAAAKIDTSLFASSRNLGQRKQTKKEAMRHALLQQQAGLAIDGLSDNISEDESSDEAEGDEPAGSAPLEHANISPEPPQTTFSAGSGLKRPLEVDDGGRPVLQKRQKRGGIKSKFQLHSVQAPPEDPDGDEWKGFSDEEAPESESGQETQSSPAEGDDDSMSESDSELSSSEQSVDEEEEAGEVRPSAFKAWAHRQRNEALGYESTPSSSALPDIPRPDNFKPRPMEQDPLPPELQQTTNVARKSHSVLIGRSAEIESARLALPIIAEEQKIMEAIHNHDIVVISGATGSGKTTQVPQFLFEAGYGSPDSPTPGMIGITQPRRVAAVSMSKRVAHELGDHSHVVGYQIRFEGNTTQKTAIKFMTDGVLLREVTEDLALRKYSAIIVDEAHERSVNTDVLVGILSRVNNMRAELVKEGDSSMKNLKLIIMSATLRIEDMTQNTRLFPAPPPVLEVEGRQFPVTVHFARRTRHDYVEEAFQKISRGHRKLPPGGFLVFLTGQNEIHQLSRRLKLAFNGVASAASPRVRISASEAPFEAEDVDFGGADYDTYSDGESDAEEEMEEDENEFVIEDEESGTGPRRMNVLPLYSLLPTKEQQRVFDPVPEGSRQVILATNIAETSLTIPGIRYVFDCGRSKERRYNRNTAVQSFEIGWISKASANQRSGRAGRTGPGHCYRLYSSAVFERDFLEFTVPELLRTPLEGVVLQLRAMQVPNIASFPFPTPPERQDLVRAERVLKYLAALSPAGQVTPAGSAMSVFPLSPRFAKILLVGNKLDCMPYTIAMVAALSAGEIFLPPDRAPKKEDEGEDGKADRNFRTLEDVKAENERADRTRAYNAVHKNFCSLDDRSDTMKLLQVVGEFAHDPTEAFCAGHFTHFKALKEAQKLRYQLTDLLKTHAPEFANLVFQDKLGRPSERQVALLKQMVAAGFLDQVAIRADKAPNPPEMRRKPSRAIDVPYLPLVPLEVGSHGRGDDGGDDDIHRMVYIHPSSPLAHLSTAECPDYVVYAYLQRAGGADTEAEEIQKKKPRTRMHALTDVTGDPARVVGQGHVTTQLRQAHKGGGEHR